MSGGERQRVLLVRAIAQHTPVLVLDEPTNHLDLKHQTRLAAVLRQLADQGRTIVAALHDLNLAMHADKVLLLVDGEARAYGPPEDTLDPKFVHEVYDVGSGVLNNPLTGRPTLLYADTQGK